MTLPEDVQRSLAALFVVITEVFGMAIGDLMFLRLSVRSGLAKGAGLGASSHGAGTAKAYEMGQQEGVVSSLVMMLAGILAASFIGRLMW
nr:LrgB family protein [Edaphovirga cremea]